MNPSGNIYYITVCFLLLCPYNGIAKKVIQYRWDRTAWCVWVILQSELRTPGVISLCHKMTRQMNVREPLYDVNKTLTEAFHYIIIQLSFHNPNTDTVLQWTQPGICVTSWEVPLLQPRKGLANACIQYRWDRIAWWVGVIFQHEGSTPRVISFYHILTPHMSVGLIEQLGICTPRVISLYHIITPHKNVWGHFTTWNEHSRSYFIIIWYLYHRCHRFPWPTEDIMQLKIRASGVMSLYNRISPHGSE